MFVSFFIQIQPLYNINKIIGFMLMTIYNRMFTDKLTDVNVNDKIYADRSCIFRRYFEQDSKRLRRTWIYCTRNVMYFQLFSTIAVYNLY